MKSTNIFFSVGEPSGDLHAANLVRQLHRLNPHLSFRGFGGPKLRATGCQVDFELTNLAVVGFAEVLPKLREFFRIADIASDIFDKQRPDAVVLVDFPGFNWHIAKRAKERGIPVTYYLPPQLWAWGEWRLKKMRRNVDHILCNLPFEAEWYRKRGVEVDYVGHPFFDEVLEHPLDPKFMGAWQQHGALQVAVLPGSRSREVQHIWPMQLSMIREICRRHPGTRFMVACLKDRHCLWCRQQLTESDANLDVNFFVGRTSEIIQLSDCALIKSGSVSLELMARGTPAVVVYHASRLLYSIGRRLSNVQSMTLPNLIAKKTIMPEFLAVGATQKTIEQATEALDHLVSSADARREQREQLSQLSRQFAQPGASRRAAQKILHYLHDDQTLAPSVAFPTQRASDRSGRRAA